MFGFFCYKLLFLGLFLIWIIFRECFLIFLCLFVCFFNLIWFCLSIIKNEIIISVNIIIKGILVSNDVVFNIFNVCFFLISIKENGSKYNVNV